MIGGGDGSFGCGSRNGVVGMIKEETWTSKRINEPKTS
jgi:hypothetical protein